MAATPGQYADRLKKDLIAEPFRYEFLHALRALGQIYPDAPFPGDATRPRQEPYRLHQRVDLRFAPSSIESIREDPERKLLEFMVYFLGLSGPNGPLPIAWSEYVLERNRQFDDVTLESFFNIFNHRILALFYKSWALNHPAVDYERGTQSRFSRLLRSFIGLGTEGLEKRDTVDDRAKLFFSGHLRPLVRHAEGLASVLSGYFEMPVRIDEFQGQWLTLPENARCRLGESAETGLMGSTLIVGSNIWECQLKFRIVFGPLSMSDFQRLLPQGEGFGHLRDWVRLYIGLEFAWEVQLILRRDEIGLVQLGETAYLGWTTWLTSGPVDEDRGDLLINGDDA